MEDARMKNVKGGEAIATRDRSRPDVYRGERLKSQLYRNGDANTGGETTTQHTLQTLRDSHFSDYAPIKQGNTGRCYGL